MIRVLTIFAALATSACERSNDRICGFLAERPALGSVPKTADDQLQITASCVERWAARLAGAPDAASQVAEAVIGGCADAISFYENAKAKEQPGSEMAIDAARDYWRRRAQFIVVQTRAGNCYKDA